MPFFRSKLGVGHLIEHGRLLKVFMVIDIEFQFEIPILHHTFVLNMTWRHYLMFVLYLIDIVPSVVCYSQTCSVSGEKGQNFTYFIRIISTEISVVICGNMEKK